MVLVLRVKNQSVGRGDDREELTPERLGGFEYMRKVFAHRSVRGQKDRLIGIHRIDRHMRGGKELRDLFFLFELGGSFVDNEKSVFILWHLQCLDGTLHLLGERIGCRIERLKILHEIGGGAKVPVRSLL